MLEDLHFTISELNHKATLIKTVALAQDRHINQWSRTESKNKPLCNRWFNFDLGIKIINEEKKKTIDVGIVISQYVKQNETKRKGT